MTGISLYSLDISAIFQLISDTCMAKAVKHNRWKIMLFDQIIQGLTNRRSSYWQTFYNYGGDHQECLAHIQRYLQDAIDNEPDLIWHKQMKSLFSEIIHEARQDSCFSPDRILQIEKEYDTIVQTAREEYKKHPPNKYFPDGFNLLERIAAYKKNHLLFLSHPEIEYTNNRAERGLRKFKRKLKQAITFRCNHSIEDLCNCLSIIETRRQQGSNLFLTTQEAFS